MSGWLKNDPKNGYLVGPSGCHYSNEHQAAHFDLLHLCGCGRPEDAFNFCRDVLSAFDRRGVEGLDGWINAEGAVRAIIVARPDEAAHVISHLLTHLDLLEHGGSVGGSWLTDDGARIVDLGPTTDEIMDQEEPFPREEASHG
jgi:hypothetical protein